MDFDGDGIISSDELGFLAYIDSLEKESQDDEEDDDED